MKITTDQISLLKAIVPTDISNVEAIVLRTLKDNPDALPREEIFAIAQNRYAKSDSGSYYAAIDCLVHYGLVEIVNGILANKALVTNYRLTPDGTTAINAILA